MRRAFVFTVAFAALALGSMNLADAGGCATKPGTSEGQGVEVKLANCGFLPTILHAPVGAKVTWFNGDYLPHAVNGLGWDASAPGVPANPGTNVSHVFTQPGIYPYMCYVHPGMAGVIVVGEVALNPNSDGSTRTDAVAATPVTPAPAAASALAFAAPIAIGLVAIGGLVGYAIAMLRRYRWADGALALRRRHGVHAR